MMLICCRKRASSLAMGPLWRGGDFENIPSPFEGIEFVRIGGCNLGLLGWLVCRADLMISLSNRWSDGCLAMRLSSGQEPRVCGRGGIRPGLVVALRWPPASILGIPCFSITADRTLGLLSLRDFIYANATREQNTRGR